MLSLRCLSLRVPSHATDGESALRLVSRTPSLLGQTLEIGLDALPGKTYEGKVFAINPLVDAAGRSIVIRAIVRNPDTSLRPGMFARVRLITRDEKVKMLKAMLPLAPENLVRGQFRGYLQEPGVKPDSQVETFAVMKLEIDSWRWHGVHWYVRAGKQLPAHTTEVVVARPTPSAPPRVPPPRCRRRTTGSCRGRAAPRSRR